MLLDNRHEAVLQGMSSMGERLAWKFWKIASLNRSLLNMGNARLKNWVVNRVFKGWTANRSDLDFAGKTFNEWWKEQETPQ
jgi:L-lactate dehydrogenase complex protein LldF